MSKFTDVQKEIEGILPNSPLDFDLEHARIVLKWVLRLKPDADEALKIAAIAHDIDRAITGITEKDLKDYSQINVFKKDHSLRSAQFIREILEKHGYDTQIISKVVHLVENHEFGGDNESDILRDADSIAYFEYNIPGYLKRNGKERTIGKIKFMYNRLSEKAKKMVMDMPYKDPELGQLVKESIAE